MGTASEQSEWYTAGGDVNEPSISDLATTFSYENPDDPAMLAGQSAAGQASADPRALDAQEYGLERLGYETDLASRGILTPQQRALYEQTRGQGEQVGRGGREAAMQQMAARGQTGSDTDMLAGQMGQQQTMQARAASDAQMQSALAQRAQQMRSAYSRLSQQARGESFDESMSRGRAQDDTAWFDTDWQREAAGRNVERQHSESQDEANAGQQWWQNYAGRYASQDGARAHRVERQYNQNNQERQRMTDVYQELLDTAGSIVGSGAGGGDTGGDAGGYFGAAGRRRRA